MAKVYNWQIGRDMEYLYDAPRPQRQFAAVFDTNKCIACQSCTIACKMTWTSGRGQEYMFWNNVETKPYGGYPINWDLHVLQLLDGGAWEGNKYTGKTLYEKAQEKGETVEGFLPAVDDWAYPNTGEDEGAGIQVEGGMHMTHFEHPIWFYYVPRMCNHCTFPSCVAACPRKSVYKNPNNGIVLIDQSRCQGYKQCVKGCPYKKSMFNSTTGRSEKCVGCFPKVEKGLTTQCIENCIGKIRLQGFISPHDKIQADNPLDYLVHVRKMALPLYPQFGTEAQIYYIPPIHVPLPFLKQMFGPGVEQAVKVYREELPQDAELQALLMLFGSSREIITRFKTTKTEAIGYRFDGREVARVPLTEKHVVRDMFDAKRDVFRMDIT